MRLLMAVSRDGYLCKGPDDDMSWTGEADKRVFKSLSLVYGVCFMGSRTAAIMKAKLPGRTLHTLSRSGSFTLQTASIQYPHAWLLGGPTVAYRAIVSDYVNEAHLCFVQATVFECPITLERMLDPVSVVPLLQSMRSAGWQRSGSVNHDGGVKQVVFRRSVTDGT